MTKNRRSTNSQLKSVEDSGMGRARRKMKNEIQSQPIISLLQENKIK